MRKSMERVRMLLLSAIAAVVLSACGSDATGPEEIEFENVAGTYAGVLSGESQGVTLDGTFGITISQSSGNLSGNWSTSGTLDDGSTQVSFQGSGALSGTIGAGTNPSVNITTTSPACPSREASFSGTYDSANRQLTLTGPFTIVDENCDDFLTYNMVLVLSR